MSSEINRCISACRRPILAIAALSGGSNVLALTGALFMLTVYDRVIPSGSLPTLISLGIIALFAYLLQGVIDTFRLRMLTRIGLVVRETINPRLFDIVVRGKALKRESHAQAVRDLDQVQAFLSSIGPTAFFDLPWLPLYVGICFAMHPYIGYTVIAGALFLLLLTFISNILTQGYARRVSLAVSKRDTLLTSSEAEAETLQAMGMTPAMAGSWNRASDEIAETTLQNADISGAIGTLSRSTRLALQSLVIGVGAYLVINQLATGGIIIAGSILSARALAPIDLAIGNWRNFVTARQAWARLDLLLRRYPPEERRHSAPLPERAVRAQNVSIMIPGIPRIIVRDISFDVAAGKGLGIIGPTGSGKSTLAKAVAGLWEPMAGVIRFDGFEMASWSSVDRGRFIGYLPQDVALFEGTIAQNIARFDPDADQTAITNAAQTAGVHEMVSKLPDGYNTRITVDGAGLSGGQAQRIGLARALYGDPFLLILDEPNSNLDTEGEIALQDALLRHQERGGCFVLIAHRPSILNLVDQILVMQDGRSRMYGDRDKVMEAMRGRGPAPTRSRPQKPEILAPQSGNA